jgi:hypothetical protein
MIMLGMARMMWLVSRSGQATASQKVVKSVEQNTSCIDTIVMAGDKYQAKQVVSASRFTSSVEVEQNRTPFLQNRRPGKQCLACWIYRASKSLLETYPDSMLARLVSDTWNKNAVATSTARFLDRNDSSTCWTISVIPKCSC